MFQSLRRRGASEIPSPSLLCEQMFDSMVAARRLLDEVAVGFDAAGLSAEAAVRVVAELGAIRRTVDGMVAKTARRVAESESGSGAGGGDGAALVARTLGVGAGEV